MSLATLLAAFITFALLIVWLTAVSNFVFFPRLQATTPKSQPFVSVLIPARNEAGVIGNTVTRLLAQTYPHFELIVLDDNSEDDTAVLAQQSAGEDGRFRLIKGQPLPPGWLGKNWACHQLSQAVRGDILLFTDADVVWQPSALAALVASMRVASGEYASSERLFAETKLANSQTRKLANAPVDMVTVWPTQTTVTWAERLVVPTMALAILGYLPILPVHFTRWPIFAAANGQCLALRREMYDRIGGHTAVADNIVEDVGLARLVKQAGGTLRMFDGNHLIGCRMYDGWQQVRDGFAKNILAGHGNSVPFLLLSTVFHWLVFVYPLIWLLVQPNGWAAALLLAGVGVRAATAVFTHQRPLDALLMPVSVLLMTRIAFQSIRWHFGDGPVWKGRTAKLTIDE